MLDGDLVVANDLVNFLLHLEVGCGVLQQVVESKRKQSRSGFVTSDEEGDQLVADVGVVQLLASGGINAVKHSAQQVLAVSGMLLASLDDTIGSVLHDGDVVEVLLVGSLVQEVWRESRSSVAATGFGQEITHSLDERVHLILVIRVEAEVHGAECEGIKSQTGEIVADVHWLIGMASQLHSQL